MTPMNNNQGSTTTGGSLSPEPPPIGMSGGGGDRLVPGVKLRPRTYTTVASDLSTVEEDFVEGGKKYIGQNLVDSNGVISRSQYSEDEAYSELARFQSAAARKNFLTTLQALGLYGNSKVSSNGFANRDLSAVRQAMLYANAEGVTLDRAVAMMQADPSVRQAAISGRRVRTTATQDLRTVFKQVSLNTLGRQLSDAEVDKFVKAYNRSEVSEAMGGATVASPQVAAQEAVMSAAPEEAAAVGASRLASIMDQMIKGLA